jgi:hypothetical protein
MWGYGLDRSGSGKGTCMGYHMTYNVYIKLYKINGYVIPWPVIMSELCTQKYRIIKNVEMRFLCF